MAEFKSGNFAAALREFRPLAEQGDSFAQNALDTMYNNGDGVTQDYAEAARWYRLAAEQGDRFAQFNLCNYYYAGTGVQQNDISGLMWWAIAGAQGDQDALTIVESLEGQMSEADFLKGHRRAQACLESNYQDCD